LLIRANFSKTRWQSITIFASETLEFPSSLEKIPTLDDFIVMRKIMDVNSRRLRWN